MQITVKSTTKESKQAQGKTYWGVKHADGNWYNVIQDDKPAQGAKIEVEVKSTEWQGRTYRWATPKQTRGSSGGGGQGSSNGHIPWEDYRAMAQAAHGMAAEMEPDDLARTVEGETPIMAADRSSARAAILNTVMIAFANGKLSLPKDEPPPPADDDVPF